MLALHGQVELDDRDDDDDRVREHGRRATHDCDRGIGRRGNLGRGCGTSGGLPPISTGTFTTMPAGESSTGERGLTEPIPGAESSSEGGSPAELSCDAGCAPGIDCGLADEAAYDACFDACFDTYENGSAECVAALAALNDCLVELECTDYGTWMMGTPPDVPCNAENEAKAAACAV